MENQHSKFKNLLIIITLNSVAEIHVYFNHKSIQIQRKCNGHLKKKI